MTEAVAPVDPAERPLGQVQEEAQRLADLTVTLDYFGGRVLDCHAPRPGLEEDARRTFTTFLVVLTQVRRIARETERWLAAHEAAE